MKTLRATFLSLLITSIASARAQKSVSIRSGLDQQDCATVNLDNESSVKIVTCDNSPAQIWSVGAPGQSSQFTVPNSSLCLTVGLNNGVEITPCIGSAKQLWIYFAVDGLTEIKLSDIDTCLDQTITTNNGTLLSANTCTGGIQTQEWMVVSSD